MAARQPRPRGPRRRALVVRPRRGDRGTVLGPGRRCGHARRAPRAPVRGGAALDRRRRARRHRERPQVPVRACAARRGRGRCRRGLPLARGAAAPRAARGGDRRAGRGSALPSGTVRAVGTPALRGPGIPAHLALRVQHLVDLAGLLEAGRPVRRRGRDPPWRGRDGVVRAPVVASGRGGAARGGRGRDARVLLPSDPRARAVHLPGARSARAVRSGPAAGARPVSRTLGRVRAHARIRPVAHGVHRRAGAGVARRDCLPP